MSARRVDVEYAGCSRCGWTDESPFAQVHLDNHWTKNHADEAPLAWELELGGPKPPRVMGWTQTAAQRRVEQERLWREGKTRPGRRPTRRAA